MVSARRHRPAWLANFRAQADRAVALARYARLAPRYEDTTTRIREVHLRALDLLALRPDESVAGRCLLPTWGTPVNAWVLWGEMHYRTTWRGLRAPWVPLLEWFPDLSLVERYHWGKGYLAVGTVRSR